MSARNDAPPGTSRVRRELATNRVRWLVLPGLVTLGLAAALVVATSASGATGPKNTAPPAISGTPQAGQTLVATTGTWTGSGLITYDAQWQRCDGQGANCDDLPFGRSFSLTLGSGDVNRTLRIVVTARDANGRTATTSAPTAIVGPAPVGAPALTTPPTIAGTAGVGQTLTANPGTWTGAAITYAYAWQRCDADGAGCVPIAGASAATYVVADADAGGTLRVVVTATNPSGVASGTSVPSALVPGSPGGITTLPNGGKSVAVADIALPNQLLIAGSTFTPSQLSSRSPFTLKVRIHDTRGYAVKGAVVYVLGVPYSRIATVPEAATAADGTVTFTLHPLEGLSLGKGQYLVVFLRARKPGDPVNGGVSVRQLVQVRTGPSA